jgi:tRNA nucleotidyltransferase (CCA-adding enzyme)
VAALRRLKASNAEIGRAAAIVEGPPAPAGESELAARHWLARVGGAADDLIAMHVLRHGVEPQWSAAVRAVRARGDAVSRGDLAIGGNDLHALGVHGKRVGEVLAVLLERVLDDPSLNTRETLLALARELA